MARTDGLLHLFGRHSFPRGRLGGNDVGLHGRPWVRGENPVNHGMAVLLEVEALLTDRGRGQHERPAGRIERLTHKRDRPEPRQASTRAAGTDFPQPCAREAAERDGHDAVSDAAADRRLREAANLRQRPAPICSTSSHADLPSVPARSFTCSSAARVGRGSCKPALATRDAGGFRWPTEHPGPRLWP